MPTNTILREEIAAGGQMSAELTWTFLHKRNRVLRKTSKTTFNGTEGDDRRYSIIVWFIKPDETEMQAE